MTPRLPAVASPLLFPLPRSAAYPGPVRRPWWRKVVPVVRSGLGTGYTDASAHPLNALFVLAVAHRYPGLLGLLPTGLLFKSSGGIGTVLIIQA